MEEGLSSEHRCELLSNALEHILDGGGVSKEGDGHFQSLWWNIAHGGFDVIWDPLDEVGAVLVLDVKHLLIDFLRGHSSSEHGGSGQISAVARIGSAHHVLSVEHLLSKLWDGKSTVLLGTARSQRSESSQEKFELIVSLF